MSNDPSQPPAEPDPLVPDLPVAAEQLPPSDDLTPVDSAGDPLAPPAGVNDVFGDPITPAAEQGPVADVNPVDPAGAPADSVPLADGTHEVETQDASGAPSGHIVTTPADALSSTTVDASVGVGAGTPPDAASAPPISETATSPATGEQIRTGDNSVIAPLGANVDQAVIDDPAVPVVAAHEDPTGAAQAVLDKERPAASEVVQTRAELNAQRVLDEGTLTPAVPGAAVAPVETLDHHTVDPTGTADDHQPGAFVEERPRTDADGNEIVGSDADTSTVDTRVAYEDRLAKGQGPITPELGESLIVSSVKTLAEVGVHQDLVHQWVDQAFADLQGQRSSAQSAGDADPYPGLAI